MSETLAINSTISYYRIAKKLGAGMCEVYLAEDTRLDRKVALKILPREFTGMTLKNDLFGQLLTFNEMKE